MTDYYLDTDLTTGSNDGTSAANAWQSWASVTGVSAGDRVFVKAGSTEERTATIIIPALTNNNRGGFEYVCVDNLTDKNYTTARSQSGELTVNVTNGDLNVNDSAQFYGVSFRVVDGSDDMKLGASNVEPNGYFDSKFIVESQADVINFGGVHDSCIYGSGTPDSSGTFTQSSFSTNGPTELFNATFENVAQKGSFQASCESSLDAMGGDFSAFTKTGFDLFTSAARQPQILRGAKMPASYDLHSGIGSSDTPFGNRFIVIGCTDDATNDPGHFQSTHRNFLFTKTTATYVTAQPSKQSSDTTPHSMEVEYSEPDSWDYYLEGGAGALPLSALANTQTTSMTLTWEFLVADAVSTTALTSNAVWVYVWYLGSATSAGMTQLKSRPFDPMNVLTLSAGTGTSNWTIDASVPSNRASYKIAHTFTPAQAGPIYYQVRIAGLLGNDEMYYDPIPIIT